MSISLTQILIQQGYLTPEQYNYAYQIQQNQAVEVRKPLSQIYLEEGFFGIEHIDYCLRLKQQYLQDGYAPEFDESAYQQQAQESSGELSLDKNVQPEVIGDLSGTVTCKVCLSECQAGWAMCPFCGNGLR